MRDAKEGWEELGGRVMEGLVLRKDGKRRGVVNNWC